MKTIIATLLIGMTLPVLAADKPKTATPDQTLSAGAYTATAKAIVCEGCGQFITDALKTNPSLENISVDVKTKSVNFQVKKDAKVKTSDLQRALKAKADEMGMGADYTLSGVKKLSRRS